MQKSQKYALIGFVSGFVLTFSGCKLYIGRTLHGESETLGLLTGLLFGALFAILGSILGNSEEKNKIKKIIKPHQRLNNL